MEREKDVVKRVLYEMNILVLDREQYHQKIITQTQTKYTISYFIEIYIYIHLLLYINIIYMHLYKEREMFHLILYSTYNIQGRIQGLGMGEGKIDIWEIMYNIQGTHKTFCIGCSKLDTHIVNPKRAWHHFYFWLLNAEKCDKHKLLFSKKIMIERKKNVPWTKYEKVTCKVYKKIWLWKI